MNTIQPTMKVLKISELTDLKQKQQNYYQFRGALTASLGICSTHAKKTQPFATVGEVENEYMRLQTKVLLNHQIYDHSFKIKELGHAFGIRQYFRKWRLYKRI